MKLVVAEHEALRAGVAAILEALELPADLDGQTPVVLLAFPDRVATNEPSRTGPPQHLLSRLTRREVEIMEAVGQGLNNAAIAKRFFLSEKTVKNHINRIYTKLGFGSRTEAVSAWHGAATPPCSRTA